MPGVYLDFQQRYGNEDWQMFEQLADAQVELIESRDRGYIRLFFPETIGYDSVLDAIETITCKQSHSWYFDHEGRVYRSMLPKEKYDVFCLNVNERMQKIEPKVRSIIRKDLEKIVRERNCFNVSGYFQFYGGRLQRLLQKLANEEYQRIEEEMEQEDFISLLQLFISVQEPVIDVAYLSITDLEHFQLEDRLGNDLTEEYLASVDVEDISGISNKDLIMSVLVTMIPRKIVLDVQGTLPKDFLKLLEKVFADRLQYQH